MKLGLWLCVLLVIVHIADSGRIVRTWRRQGRVGPRMRLRPRPYSMWSFFRRPRVLRRNHQPPFRRQEHMPPIHVAPSEFPQERIATIQMPTSGRFPKHPGWRPVINHGNPLHRNPTFSYAPPTNEQVKFAMPRRRRPPMGRNKIRGWRPPPHPFWKLLGMKQRRMPPRPPPKPELSDEAESTHYVPNIVYFHTNDVVDGTTTTASSIDGLRPGVVSDVPLYPKESTAPSEFKPMPTTPTEFKPMPTTAPGGKDLLLRVVNFLGGAPKKGATVLRPVTTTPETRTTSQKSAPTPADPTVSLFDLIQPPDPINSFNINIDAAAEGSSSFIKMVPAPSDLDHETSSTPISITTTETLKPIFALRSTEETLTEESTTTSVSSTTMKSSIYKLPTMPAYKRKVVPVFPKKIVNLTKSSREQMGDGDMSSSIMITGIRSKVKEYKPQMLANYSQLLAFDKVSETTEESSTLKPTSLSPKTSSSAEVQTSTSPMQAFDPLNMLHSWLMKS